MLRGSDSRKRRRHSSSHSDMHHMGKSHPHFFDQTLLLSCHYLDWRDLVRIQRVCIEFLLRRSLSNLSQCTPGALGGDQCRSQSREVREHAGRWSHVSSVSIYPVVQQSPPCLLLDHTNVYTWLHQRPQPDQQESKGTTAMINDALLLLASSSLHYCPSVHFHYRLDSNGLLPPSTPRPPSLEPMIARLHGVSRLDVSVHLPSLAPQLDFAPPSVKVNSEHLHQDEGRPIDETSEQDLEQDPELPFVHFAAIIRDLANTIRLVCRRGTLQHLHIGTLWLHDMSPKESVGEGEEEEDEKEVDEEDEQNEGESDSIDDTKEQQGEGGGSPDHLPPRLARSRWLAGRPDYRMVYYDSDEYGRGVPNSLVSLVDALISAVIPSCQSRLRSLSLGDDRLVRLFCCRAVLRCVRSRHLKVLKVNTELLDVDGKSPWSNDPLNLLPPLLESPLLASIEHLELYTGASQPAHWSSLIFLTQLRSLACQVNSDEHMQLIARLPNLSSLTLDFSMLSRMVAMSQLEREHEIADGSTFSEGFFVSLSSMHQLEELTLMAFKPDDSSWSLRGMADRISSSQALSWLFGRAPILLVPKLFSLDFVFALPRLRLLSLQDVHAGCVLQWVDRLQRQVGFAKLACTSLQCLQAKEAASHARLSSGYQQLIELLASEQSRVVFPKLWLVHMGCSDRQLPEGHRISAQMKQRFGLWRGEEVEQRFIEQTQQWLASALL